MHTRRLLMAALAALVAALAAAFVVAPPRLASTARSADLVGEDHLVAAVRPALADYWFSGDRAYPPGLQRVVDYWFRFHLVKGAIALLLLIVLVGLAVVLRRWGRAAVAPLALAALVALVANVQGAAAPFASLLPMLMDGPSDVRVADTVAQARQQLAGSHRTTGYTPPALDAMVGDFTRYHAALAVVAAVVVVALLSLGVVLWRRRVRGFAVFSALVSLAVIVVVVANTGTAMDPAPALLGLFNGGF